MTIPTKEDCNVIIGLSVNIEDSFIPGGQLGDNPHDFIHEVRISVSLCADDRPNVFVGHIVCLQYRQDNAENEGRDIIDEADSVDQDTYEVAAYVFSAIGDEGYDGEYIGNVLYIQHTECDDEVVKLFDNEAFKATVLDRLFDLIVHDAVVVWQPKSKTEQAFWDILGFKPLKKPEGFNADMGQILLRHSAYKHSRPTLDGMPSLYDEFFSSGKIACIPSP
jgi:hypothetical protein